MFGSGVGRFLIKLFLILIFIVRVCYFVRRCMVVLIFGKLQMKVDDAGEMRD